MAASPLGALPVAEPVLGSPAAVPVNAPVEPPHPPPGAPAPAGTKMAPEIATPGQVVAAPTASAATVPGTHAVAPMVDAQPAGTLVIAPVAPATGNVTGPAAVVAVIAPMESKTILLSIGLFLEAMGEIALNAALPILASMLESGAPLNWKVIFAATWRPVAQALVAGAYGWWRLRDNRITGTPK